MGRRGVKRDDRRGCDATALPLRALALHALAFHALTLPALHAHLVDLGQECAFCRSDFQPTHVSSAVLSLGIYVGCTCMKFRVEALGL